ncbi:MAG: tetratricopeptide repeat protein [Candidatus Peregrinibacteria bacterium]
MQRVASNQIGRLVEPLPRLPSRAALLWIVGVFSASVFLVYSMSFANNFVRFDDGMLIYENPFIREISLSSLKKIFTSFDPELYIPLTFFSYQIDFFLGGTNAALYHFQNFLWHTLTALLVGWLCYLLSRKYFVAAFCAVLFALHPLHTEAVVWASARKDVLSAFFFLGSIIVYLYYTERGGRKLFYGSLCLFLFGLLAKVTVMTFPVILLLIDFYRGRRWTMEMFTEKIPYFALTVAFGIIAWIGKLDVIGSSSLSEKILMAPKSAVFYLEKIFLPIRLSVLYPFTGEVTLRRWDIAVPLVVCLLVILLMIFAWKRARCVSFGLAFFFTALSPTLLNFAKGDFFYFASDRYAYLASIGILFLVAMLLARIAERFSQSPARLFELLALLAVVFGGLAFRQSLQWKNSEALFRHVLSIYPESTVALNNLGNVYRLSSRREEAVSMLERALAITKKYSRAAGGVDSAQAKVLTNLASAYRDLERFPEAVRAANDAIAANPLSAQAYVARGVIAYQLKEYERARSAYEQAIALQPEFQMAHLNLGALFVALGNAEDALREYDRAIEINPLSPQAFFNKGVLLNKLNRNREAIASYRSAIALAPSFTAAHLNLGILLYERQDREEAIAEFQTVLGIDPQNRMALSALRQIGILK